MNGKYGLIDEKPLFVFPSLCEKVGINEGIALQDVHFVVQIKEEQEDDRTLLDGYMWCSRTIKKWKLKMPWFKKGDGMLKLLHRLERSGLLISWQPNAASRDQTKWYRIDYELMQLINEGKVEYKDLLTIVVPDDNGIVVPDDNGIVVSDDNDLYKKDLVKDFNGKTVFELGNTQLKVAESETPTSYKIDQPIDQISTPQIQTEATSHQLPLSQNPDPGISAKGQDQEKTLDDIP